MPKQAVEYEEVHRYLSSKEPRYATECSEVRKRAIRRFSEKCVIEDGFLFKLSKEGKRQWINDAQMQNQILESVHDSSAGGCHFGRDKTREKLASRFFWTSMYEDIDEYIKTCEKCQKVAIQISS